MDRLVGCDTAGVAAFPGVGLGWGEPPSWLHHPSRKLGPQTSFHPPIYQEKIIKAQHPVKYN